MFITILLSPLILVLIEWAIRLKRVRRQTLFTLTHTEFLLVQKSGKTLLKGPDNLELSIDMGWFWFISQPMVWFLDLINEYVNSWALSIIIFTLILKLALFPSHRQGFCFYGWNAEGWANDERYPRQV
jgi:membrane protein insertase Oxa1/YidC/SpoIIIJ